MGGNGHGWTFRRLRAALAVIVGVVAWSLAGCGGSGPAAGGASLPSSPFGSLMVTVPSEIPAGAQTFRVRALNAGTNTDATSPSEVPLGSSHPDSAGIVVPVGTVDVLAQALDSAGHAVASRKVRVAVTAGSLQQVRLTLVSSRPVLVALPQASALGVLDASTGRVETRISTVDARPATVAVASGGTMAFAIDRTLKSLIPCDILFTQAAAPTALAGVPRQIAVPASGTTGYLSVQGVSGTSDAITAFSLVDGQIVGTTAVTTGGNPSLSGLAVTPDGTRLLDLWQAAPAATTQPTLEVRSLADMSVASTTLLPAGASVDTSTLAVSTDGQLAAFTYGPPGGGSSIGVTSVATGGAIVDIPCGSGSWLDVLFTTTTTLLALDDQGTVYAFDLGSYPTGYAPGATIALPGPAAAMSLDRSTGRLWASLLGGSVICIDAGTGKTVLTTPLGQTPGGLSASPP